MTTGQTTNVKSFLVNGFSILWASQISDQNSTAIEIFLSSFEWTDLALNADILSVIEDATLTHGVF
jgi:hypothetical protein